MRQILLKMQMKTCLPSLPELWTERLEIFCQIGLGRLYLRALHPLLQTCRHYLKQSVHSFSSYVILLSRIVILK